MTFVTFAVEVRASRIDWLIVGGRDIFGSRLNLVFDVFSDVPVPARERLVERFDGCFVIFGFLKLYKKIQDGLIYLPRGWGAIFWLSTSFDILLALTALLSSLIILARGFERLSNLAETRLLSTFGFGTVFGGGIFFFSASLLSSPRALLRCKSIARVILMWGFAPFARTLS